jgi:hypothetical protein
MEAKFGKEWRQIAEDFKSIGLMRFDGKKVMWKIPIVWRKGLDVRRGRVTKE